MEQEGAGKEEEQKHIVITQYSTFRNAVCEICRWVTVDQKRLMQNVSQHQGHHQPRPSVIHRKFVPKP